MFSKEIDSSDENINGINLCNAFYSFLKENNTNPLIQTLVSSGENNFPYNIYISNNDNFSNLSTQNDKLIFSFKIEEAWQHKDLILNLQEKLSSLPIKSTILFLYETSDSFPDYHSINSCNVYLNSIDLNDNNIVYNITFNQTENTIIPGTKGYNSPSWMVYQVYNALFSSQINFKFPFIFISQLSKFRFDSDKILSTFLQNEVSAITINFNTENLDSTKINSALDYLIQDFENSKNTECDYHSLMIKFGDKSFWLSEINIIKIFIFIVLISLGFIFILGYINIQLKNDSWIQLKKNWYTLIIIFLISIAAGYLGKQFYILVNGSNLSGKSAYGLILTQIIFTLTLLAVFFFLEIFIHKPKYTGKSIDLLILLITFINQFIFCIVDISLFPIFMVVCIFSILSLIFNKNWSHIILFVLMIIFTFIYATALIQNSNTDELKYFFLTQNQLPLVLGLILMPVYLMLFRIFIEIQKNFTSKKIPLIIMGSSYLVLIISLILANSLFYSKFNKYDILPQIINIDNAQQEYTIKYTDKLIFNELIRSIELESEKEPVLIQISIEGQESVPVLYSEYDFTIKTNKTAVFDIPVYPGKKVHFSYGSNGLKEIITSKVIYKSENDSQYIVLTDVLETEDLNAAK